MKMRQYNMMLVMVMLVLVYPSYSKSVEKTRLLFSQNKFLLNDSNAKKDMKTDTSSCIPGFIKNGQYCYYFSMIGLSWKNATDMCVSLGNYYGQDMTMASPYTFEEDTFLMKEAALLRLKYQDPYGFWTTGNDLQEQDKWVWGNDPKATYTYSRWQKGEPDTPSQHCMILWNDREPWNGWADAYCFDLRPFICRYKK